MVEPESPKKETDKKEKMTDERLKIWIDLFKWFIVSVVIYLITIKIDEGFRDREVSIKELGQYDKYISYITNNDSLNQRLELAEYFSMVLVSKTLRDRWSEYKEYLIKKTELLKEDKDVLVEKRQNAKDSTIKREYAQKINQIDAQLNAKLNLKTTDPDLSLAKQWEESGFNNLLSQNITDAIAAFKNSENAYNGYHQVYELSNYLQKIQKNNNSLKQNDWEDIYRDIIKNFHFGLPKDFQWKATDILNKLITNKGNILDVKPMNEEPINSQLPKLVDKDSSWVKKGYKNLHKYITVGCYSWDLTNKSADLNIFTTKDDEQKITIKVGEKRKLDFQDYIVEIFFYNLGDAGRNRFTQSPAVLYTEKTFLKNK